MTSTDNIEVLLCTTKSKNQGSFTTFETRENYRVNRYDILDLVCTDDEASVDHIQEINVCQTDKMQYPQTLELLMDPNVFIADTGASVDSTGHKIGLQNHQNPRKDNKMTMANRSKTTTETVGDLRGTICNKQGQSMLKVMMTNVKYSPCSV